MILVDSDDRTLLFEDSDPGIGGVTWWVTPGGGMDPGETERQTAVREVAEETGYMLAEDDLVGPLATRYAVHGYSDQVLEQQESFYLARVSAFEIDTSAHTEEEQITLQGHRWWTRAEIEAGRVVDLAGAAGAAVGPCRCLRFVGTGSRTSGGVDGCRGVRAASVTVKLSAPRC